MAIGLARLGRRAAFAGALGCGLSFASQVAATVCTQPETEPTAPAPV